MTTTYDAVAYPSTVFPQTQPDRLATIARLYSLNSPDVATARVLEIGGGDGLNLIAHAAAYPRSQCLSFDLAATAVARGRALAEKAGLDNIRIEVGDILEAAETMDDRFDYIIAHGVYAWVPDAVREACMKLIGRVLSDHGVALVSYNAKPGGHIRSAIRDMLLRRVEGMTDPEEKLAVARAFLAEYGEPRDGEPAALTGLRQAARDMLEKAPAVLYHDELGPFFYPQSVSEVGRAAALNGLQYLTDAGRGLVSAAFIAEVGVHVPTETVVAGAQIHDEDKIRFFRHTLLVRDTARPARWLDPARLRTLYASLRGDQLEPGKFKSESGTYEIADPRLAGVMNRLAEAWPQRLLMKELSCDDAVAAALVQLFDIEMVDFHTQPLPARHGVDMSRRDWRPRANPVAHVMAKENYQYVCTFDHRSLALNDRAARAILSLLDGMRTLNDLEVAWGQTEYAAEMSLEDALDMVAKAAVLAKD
jgi:hypothetical protein